MVGNIYVAVGQSGRNKICPPSSCILPSRILVWTPEGFSTRGIESEHGSWIINRVPMGRLDNNLSEPVGTTRNRN